MNILFVTKDKGPFNVTYKVVPELRSRGHQVSVIAEGLSAPLWEQAGEKLLFKGSVNFQKEPFELDAASVLADLKPDVLVTTGSVPINLEQSFAEEVERRNTPIVIIEDTVGSAVRLGVTPKLVLTLNQLAVDFYRTKGVLLGGAEFIPVGSDYFNRPTIPPERINEIDRLDDEYSQIVHYSGQGRPFTREILKMAIDCIRMTDTPKNLGIGLIVRHHPKGLPPETMAQIEADLAELERDIPGTIVKTSLTSDEAASISEYTFTCFGAALNISAVMGRIPVCVMTPGCAKDLFEQTGFDTTPLAAVGAAISLAEPTSLLNLRIEHGNTSFLAQQAYAKPFPFDPGAAADAIERIMR